MRTAVVLVLVAVAFWVAFLRPGPEQAPVEPPAPGHSDQRDAGTGDASSSDSLVGPSTPPPSMSEGPQISAPERKLVPEALPEGDDVLSEMESDLMEGWVLVVGSVVTPEGVSPTELRWDFDYEGPGPIRHSYTSFSVQEHGTFAATLMGLTAWRLTISPSCGQTIFEDSFAVPPGGTVRPPTLQSIDLTNSVHVVELRVLAPDLSPARSIWVSERACRRAYWWDPECVGEGVLRKVVCRREHPVRLSDFGFRTQELTLVPGMNEAVMEPGPKVRLILEDAHFLEAGWALGATPIKGERLLPGRYLEFDTRGVIEFSFSEPGRYFLEWTLRSEGGRHHRLELIDGATDYLVVDDQSGTQDFVMSVPADFVRAKVEQLRDG